MAHPPGNLQNLTDSSEESLRALIHAIIPEAASGPSNGKLSGDAVAKLTEKLTQLMGPEAAESFQQNRNERGELLNEEGLPIIEITEPADSSASVIPPPLPVEPLIPLATLSPPDRERLRENRNRILDLLEEEERQSELQERDDALRKRKEEASKEKGKHKEARELQKKMGRALLQNMGKAQEKEQLEKEAQRLKDEEADLRRKSPTVKKKSVAFVENPESMQEKSREEVSTEWGDLTPARLQNTKRPTLLSQSLLDRHPMKMSVVERIPGGQPIIPKSHPFQKLADSDDESDQDNDSESAETDFSTTEDDPDLEKDEFDLDFAQQQREIALQYHTKRNTIGHAAAAAMMNHSHDSKDHAETTPETIREGQKPVVSQFRANRSASAYGTSSPSAALVSESFSLGASVLPASSTRTIQRAIKTGKLDSDGRLVGAEADSESEEDQGMQEVLELLRKGEVYNLGPNGEYVHAIRPSELPQRQEPSSQSVLPAHEVPQRSSDLPPPIRKPTTSKFKASLAASGRPSSNLKSVPSSLPSNNPSPSVTPISHAGRSSPKLDASSQRPAEEADTPVTLKSPSVSTSQVSPFSMIVDSPSFPRPQGTSSHTIVPSPSFPPSAQNSRRPEQPPTIISATVRESTRSSSFQATSNDDVKPEKKKSRFKAERL